ncbi:MAG: SDR family oxidoreductase [Desulfitobacteriaceae bacterium]
MNLSLHDKNAMITGAARGIGRACAEVLAAEGARVLLIDRDEAGLKETAEAIQASGGTVRAYAVDLTDRKTLRDTVNKAVEEFGSIQVLVNNAARVTTMARLPRLDDDLWDGDISINLTGSFNITKPVFEMMRDNGWGRIVFLGSLAGMMGGYAQSSYAASKMALVGFAKSVALEGARYGITANVIAPGMILTETVKQHVSEDAMAGVLKITAMGKAGTPQDVANLVAFLCSEQAKYITGEVIPISGGLDLLTLPL